jgi:hypothetical protein
VASRRESPDVVRAALQEYASRGVFQGFSERRERSGIDEYRFTWLTREPMVVRFDAARGELTFRDLLPAAEGVSSVARDVAGLIAGRSAATLPAHRRIDRRRAEVRCQRRQGRLSIVVGIRNRHAAYGVQRGVNLVHEIFVLLHASHPEYLWSAFGLPAE